MKAETKWSACLPMPRSWLRREVLPSIATSLRAYKIVGWSGCFWQCLVIIRRPEARIALPEGVLKCVVQHGGAHVQEGLHGCPVPAHLLRLVHALGHDLIDRALHELCRDRLTTSASGRVGRWCKIPCFGLWLSEG